MSSPLPSPQHSSTAYPPPSDSLIAELRTIAEEAAQVGGRIAREHFGRLSNVRLKADSSEVSEADDAAQEAILEVIHRSRPLDGLIAEESTPTVSAFAEASPATPCWVIDPIDGTRNFVRHLPDYCVSIGVMLGDAAVVGVIFAPQRDQLYSGALGQPLKVNGAAVDSHSAESDKLVAAIPSTASGTVYGLVHDWIDRLVIRNLGSTALHLALVATGQFDAAINSNSKLWDIAAGAALLNSAGATFLTPKGTPRLPVDVSSYQRDDLPNIALTPNAKERLGY